MSKVQTAGMISASASSAGLNLALEIVGVEFRWLEAQHRPGPPARSPTVSAGACVIYGASEPVTTSPNHHRISSRHLAGGFSAETFDPVVVPSPHWSRSELRFLEQPAPGTLARPCSVLSPTPNSSVPEESATSLPPPPAPVVIPSERVLAVESTGEKFFGADPPGS
ncbi:hypothetical protein AAFF_G00150170 [Aldrovandia affinis]|uniref:Uncharacterized protein n=1 Tax=Aldrovandia affinis TaxID=143900 RepID=A0AAD7R0L0_9TELE|nr:hypothetical protein AAFF_G00150170 [Aldrovandia affinis]